MAGRAIDVVASASARMSRAASGVPAARARAGGPGRHHRSRIFAKRRL